MFVSFLSLYAYIKLELALKKAELNSKISPTDLLFEFGKVYHIDIGEQEVITEVPKKLLDIETKLEWTYYPSLRRVKVIISAQVLV